MKRVVAPAAASPEKLPARFPRCIWDVGSVLGCNMSTPRIFTGRGNFLTESDVWGGAEVRLAIGAGVWRSQLA